MDSLGRVNVFVLLRRNLDVDQWSEGFTKEENPDVVPYGFHNAAALNCNISYSNPTPSRFFVRAATFVLKFDVLHVLANWRRMRQADIVWTMTEIEFMAVRFLETLFLAPKIPLIGQVIWLFSNWSNYGWLRRKLIMKLLRDTSIITVHSQSNLAIVKELVPEIDARLMRFGVSTESFPLSPPTGGSNSGPIRIFAPGGDKTRDWRALCAAFGNDDRFEVIVAIRHLRLDVIAGHRNFKAAESLSVEGFRHEYSRADFVAIPMVANPYSGITVALEAAACGAPILSSNTGGVPTYFNETEVLFVPPENPDAMRSAALTMNAAQRRAMAQRAQARFVRDEYTSKAMARRYVELSDQILAAGRSARAG